VPTKDRIEWPYVALLIAFVLMVELRGSWPDWYREVGFSILTFGLPVIRSESLTYSRLSW
jgi:hypothetical protein